MSSNRSLRCGITLIQFLPTKRSLFSRSFTTIADKLLRFIFLPKVLFFILTTPMISSFPLAEVKPVPWYFFSFVFLGSSDFIFQYALLLITVLVAPVSHRYSIIVLLSKALPFASLMRFLFLFLSLFIALQLCVCYEFCLLF